LLVGVVSDPIALEVSIRMLHKWHKTQEPELDESPTNIQMFHWRHWSERQRALNGLFKIITGKYADE
jgi:hypothetical protein